MVGQFRTILAGYEKYKYAKMINFATQSMFKSLRKPKVVGDTVHKYQYGIYANNIMGYLGLYATGKVLVVMGGSFAAIGGLHLISARRHTYVKDY
jgi:hypothetical protein